MTIDVHTSVLGLLKQGAWFGALPPALQKLIPQESVVPTDRKGQVRLRRILVLGETRLRNGRKGDDAADAHDRAPRRRGRA